MDQFSPSPFEHQTTLPSDEAKRVAEVFPGPVETPAETEARLKESKEIESRFAAMLDSRTHKRSYAPDYVNSLPRSAIEKLRVTPEEQEEILYYYASTSSIPATQKATGIASDKIKAVVYNPISQPVLTELRTAMRATVMQKIEETQVILLDALQDPDKLKQSSLTQIADVFTGISTQQIQLVHASEVHSGFVHEIEDPSDLFTGDELEYMAFLRRRLQSPSLSASSSSGSGTPGGGGVEASPFGDNLDLSHVSMNGHEFVDPDYDVGTPKDQEFEAEEIMEAVDRSEGLSGISDFVHSVMSPPNEED